MGNIEDKIDELEIELPQLNSTEVGLIDKVKEKHNFLFVSGHGPEGPNGEWVYTGKVGKDITVEEGFEAAKLCMQSCLASIKYKAGSLDNVEEIIRVRGFVSSDPEFYDQPKVVNGASELLLDIFGEKGRSSRTAVGVAVLPNNISVEIDMLVKLKDDKN